MPVIDIATFRLASGVDEGAFLDADRRVQNEFIPNHPGFARRTTARGADGGWVVITLWSDAESADASAALAADDPIVHAFTALLDGVATARYETLD